MAVRVGRRQQSPCHVHDLFPVGGESCLKILDERSFWENEDSDRIRVLAPAMPAETSVSIVVLSDTHGKHHKMQHQVPPGDLLIHAGDFCSKGKLPEVADFAAWFGSFPHSHKVVIPGNHDRAVEERPGECRGMFAEHGVKLLISEGIQAAGLHLYGSPYTPRFNDWHFMLERGRELRAEWAKIPLNTDILVTHGPPYGHGDKVLPRSGVGVRKAGCLELLERVRKVRPRLHVFGHIHEDYGVTLSDEIPETQFANASICDRTRAAANPPLSFEIDRS